MVYFVNCFEIPAGEEERFLGLWRGVNAYMAIKPGYVSHRLHRSMAPDARFRFVNYAEWTSAELFEAAHDDGFRHLLADPQWRDFVPNGGLYEAIHEGPQQ
ncbi:MAG TPA: antibiotic biosynthesis monooxygenase [Mycobacteriales bacterium]|jgi:heme-degrading monooxygenase HmoA|nr:antibiotic biosynthesis monooxygenase [Mycobacteriales bacterium]